MATAKPSNKSKQPEADQNQQPDSAASADDVTQTKDDAEGKAPVIEAAATEQLTVVVPKRFQLTVGNGKILKFAPGVQKMDPEIANHWYTKANGVTIFNAD
jgi:hypothetical protein